MEDRRRSELLRDSGGVSCDWLLRASIVYGLMDGWLDGRMDGWTDGRTDGLEDGWMEGQRQRWKDGRA